MFEKKGVVQLGKTPAVLSGEKSKKIKNGEPVIDKEEVKSMTKLASKVE